MVYSSRTWRTSLSLASSTPKKGKKEKKKSSKGTRYKISFGFWMRITVDGPGLPPSAMMVRTLS